MPAFPRVGGLMAVPAGLNYFIMLPDGSRFIGERPIPATPGSGRVEAVVNWFTELEARLPSHDRGG